MTSPIETGPTRDELALHDRAMDNLRYIRETMERAGSFTAVPGRAAMGVGLTALIAAWLAGVQATAGAWLAVWAVAAVAAPVLGGWAVVRKARSAALPILSGPGRKAALTLAPALVAGGVLTAVLFRAGLIWPLPGMWLLLYGVGVVGAGTYSVRIVPLMGACFMAVGVAALLTPGWGDVWMAVGFGGLHLLFGALIAWRHGG